MITEKAQLEVEVQTQYLSIRSPRVLPLKLPPRSQQRGCKLSEKDLVLKRLEA